MLNPMLMPPKIQTVQQTSKRWKAIMASGVISILIGFGWLFIGIVSGGSVIPGFVLLILGLATYFVARIGGWWNHG